MSQHPRVIYMITHNVTKRMYIGSTNDYQARITNHLYKLRGHYHDVEDMQADFDKYGEDYTFQIIGKINNITENYKEYEAMDKYGSCNRAIGYNYKDPHVNNKIRANKKEAK